MATQNRLMPAIQGFSNFLQSYSRQQMMMFEKMHELDRKKGMETFGASLNDAFTKVKDEKQLASLIGSAYSQALSQGYNEMLPVINSYAQVRQSGMKAEEEERLSNLLISTIGEDEQVFIGNKLMTVKDVKAQYQDKFNDPAVFYKYLSQLPKPKTESSVYWNPTTNNFAFDRGFYDPKGAWHSTEQGAISTSQGVTYLEKGGGKGFQSETDRLLTPDEMKQYTAGAKEQNTQRYYDAMKSLSEARFGLEKEQLDLNGLKELRSNAYFAELGLYENLFENELENFVKTKLEKGEFSGADAQNYRNPESKEYKNFRARFINENNQPVESASNEKLLQKYYKKDYEIVSGLKTEFDEINSALNSGWGVKEYRRAKREYEDILDKSKDPDVLYEWELMTPTERVDKLTKLRRSR